MKLGLLGVKYFVSKLHTFIITKHNKEEWVLKILKYIWRHLWKIPRGLVDQEG